MELAVVFLHNHSCGKVLTVILVPADLLKKIS